MYHFEGDVLDEVHRSPSKKYTQNLRADIAPKPVWRVFAQSCIMSVVHMEGTNSLTWNYTSSVQFCVWLNPRLQIALDILFTNWAQFTHDFIITFGRHALVAAKYSLQSSKRYHRGFTETCDVEYSVLNNVSQILIRTPNLTSGCEVCTINWQSYFKSPIVIRYKKSPILVG
jgi:hypothetical protein